jgi:hypothetical protein
MADAWSESRRRFLAGTAKVAGAALATRPLSMLAQDAATLHKEEAAPVFGVDDPAWKKTWDAAIAVLAGNIRSVPGYKKPVLFEGSTYRGIWQECGPHEGLVYATLAKFIPGAAAKASPDAAKTSPDAAKTSPLEAARNNHMAFFELQRADGQLPASVRTTENGFGQIQMVVPIAATAWELSQLSGDEELLTKAYSACSRWDAWLRQ